MTRRVISGGDLPAALQEAQEALEASQVGTQETWVLPGGEHHLARRLRLGSGGRSLTIEGADTVLAFDLDGTGAEEEAALEIIGVRLFMSDVSVRAQMTGHLVGLSLRAAERMQVGRLDLGQLRGRTVRGVVLNAPRVVAEDLTLDRLRAETGPVIGLEVEAATLVELRDIDLRQMQGERVTGLQVEASSGEIADVSMAGLTASTGAATAVVVSEGVSLSEISVERELDGSDLEGSLLALQALLEQLPAGAQETWVLPRGGHTLSRSLALGVAGRALHLQGNPSAAARTILVFEDGGPVTGDLVGLDLSGTNLLVDGLDIRARATGQLTGIRARATGEAQLTDVELEGLRGQVVTALDVEATTTNLVDINVSEVRATAGTATGVLLNGDRVLVSRLNIRDIAGSDLARGLEARASVALDASMVWAEYVRADQAEAVRLQVAGELLLFSTGLASLEYLDRGTIPPGLLNEFRLSGVSFSSQVTVSAEEAGQRWRITSDRRAYTVRREGNALNVYRQVGELSVLDVRAEHVETPSDGGDAIGVTLLSGGDLDVRGLSVENIEGARGTAVFAAAARGVNWLVGDVRDVRGTSAGAAGVRVLVSPSQQNVAVRDLQVVAVRASVNGSQARPSTSWTNWIDQASPALVRGGALPPLPSPGSPEHQEDVVGLHVGARVTEFEPWVDHADPGAVFVEQLVLQRVSGTALQVEGELRDVEVRGGLAWTTVRGGWVDGERVLLTQSTWHRHHTGIEFGPCSLTLANSLITSIDNGPGVVLDAETDLDLALATFVSRPRFPLLSAPDPLPYVESGPSTSVPPTVLAGALAPDLPVDLRLQPDHPLHDEAQRVPGDASVDGLYVGAHPPDTDGRCDLRDPLPPSPPALLEPVLPSPVVDYRARDARSLMTLMMDRARSVMPDWTETNAADMTTMLMELLANRLDHLAYRQENAVTEGFLGTALLRRSVEDHARLVDYHPDPGLSATTMLRFYIDGPGIDQLGLRGRYDQGQRLEISQDTLVMNPDAEGPAVIFTTEAPLALDHALDILTLQNDIEPQAVSAVLEGDLTSLEVGRWLVITADAPETPSHVVRVTGIELGTDTTRIFWDPRRPAPTRYRAAGTRIYGNVIPAHHGVPVTPVTSPLSASTEDALELLRPWREQMSLSINNERADVQEVELPLDPVSRRAAGWPFPDETDRQGSADIQVRVNGETWVQVEDLSVQGPTEECYVVRPGPGGESLRFGDSENGAAMPGGMVRVDISARIGLGITGNVGAGALTRILAFGKTSDVDSILPPDAPDRQERIHRHLRVTNPVPAVGGRDPEPLERIRYRAPRGVRDPLSAVVPTDYERLLEALPEVAATRAVVVDAGIRPTVRVTLLLKNEDTLTGPETDPHRDAERLRRWALARSHLESIRLLGFDVELVPPTFVPLDIDVVVDAQPWVQADPLAVRVREALAGNGGLFDPDVSGLGGDVHVDTIHHKVLSVDGVAAVRLHRLRRLEPDALEHSHLGVLPIGSEEVAVLRNPYGLPAEDGLVTVTVCGGLP